MKVSIGLRSPQIYEQTKRHIRRIPESFIAALQKYFETMQEKGAIISGDPHTLAVTVFSAAFGFVFLQASFGNELSPISQEEYIKSSVKMFVKGLGNGTPFPQA